MKRILAVMLVFALAFLCVGCFGSESEPQVPADVTIAEEDDIAALEEEISDAIDEALDEIDFSVDTQTSSVTESAITETVIYDANNVKVTAKSLDYDDLFGVGISVLVENNSDKSITVQTRSGSVNGFMVDPMFSCDVAAGKKANDSITIMSDDLEAANITTIQTIEFKLYLFEAETWEDIDTSDVITLTTDATDYVQPIDDSGSVAYEGDGIKVVVKSLDSEDSFWGSDLYVYIENNSGKDVTIQTRDCSINGFMVDPVFSSDVIDGKKAFDSISFMESDLEENGITAIESIDLSFHIFDMESWDTITDTEVITITF